MKTIVVIGGYANAGKSTALNCLKKSGWDAHSTSDLLHQSANKLLDLLTDLVGVPRARLTKDDSFYAFDSGREFLISLAENVLVPVFGREIFALTVARHVLKSENPNCVVESIGGDEFEIFCDYIESFDDNAHIIPINIRSAYENSDADSRKLLPTPLYCLNEGSGKEFKKALEDLIDNERVPVQLELDLVA